jgi:hypothetical protein
MSYTPSYLGLIASGILILVFIGYWIYYTFVKKVKYAPEVVLGLLLLFTIAIGIHSLQHEGQERGPKIML